MRCRAVTISWLLTVLMSVYAQTDFTLPEVTVTGEQTLTSPENVQMSAIEVPVKQLLNVPAIGGEVDILKVIQLLPGVQSGGEGSQGLYVRGGGPDENLVMLDGAPLYNTNHALGMFSVFNADAIKDVTLYKGNFPARFGSRLSSVIDVRQKDGNNRYWHGNVSVGLIAAKVYVEGPLLTKSQLDSLKQGLSPTAKTTFLFSARRTYFDLFTAPIMSAVVRARNDSMALWTGYYFYDINGKITHTFSDKDRLSVSVYNGSDVEYMQLKRTKPRVDAENNTNQYNLNLRFVWGNVLTSVHWLHCFDDRMTLNTQVYYSGYYCRLNQSLGVQRQMYGVSSNVTQRMGYNSMINDVAARSQLTFTPNNRHRLNTGVEYIYHHFKPSVQNTFLYGMTDTSAAVIQMDTTVGREVLHGHEAALFVEDTWSPCSWFKLNYGARFSLYGIRGKVYPSVEPRVGMRFLLHRDVALKMSYSYMSQYVHLLSSSLVSMPTDLWVPVTETIPPMRSMQVAAGISYNLLNQVELSVEGYYKRSLNLLEYKEGASFTGLSGNWTEQVEVGHGWSYGVEFLAQRTIGPVTGWIGYTWSRAMRQFDAINNGQPFHAKYDREHDLSITLQYQITPRIDIAATWIYATGNRGTLATQVYRDYDIATPKEENVNESGYVNYVHERNGYKMPDYHRLDLAANFHFPGKKGEHVLNVSCYNVYCRMNPMFIEADVFSGKMYQISIFPILPSVSYKFKF